MTQPGGMSENPGDPEQNDPEVTQTQRDEAAAAEQASEAEADAIKDENFEASVDGEAQFTPELDPEVKAEIDETLSDAAPDADDNEADIKAKLAERTEDLQRLNAEYTNYRRRVERDRQSVIDSSKSRVITAFLPVLDDLDLARQHGDLNEGPLKAISDKLSSALEGQGLQSFGEEGDAFDPEIHEAVQDLSTGGEQVVGTVLRSGYRVGDKVVRNAMVIIADPENSESEN